MDADGFYVGTEVGEAGTPEGWCLIADGRKVPGLPDLETWDRMRRFAGSIGARIAGEDDAASSRV